MDSYSYVLYPRTFRPHRTAAAPRPGQPHVHARIVLRQTSPPPERVSKAEEREARQPDAQWRQSGHHSHSEGGAKCRGAKKRTEPTHRSCEPEKKMFESAGPASMQLTGAA